MKNENELREMVSLAGGYTKEDIPHNLWLFIEDMDSKIKDANAMSFSGRENFGLRSSQMIALIVILYQSGLLKTKPYETQH